MSKDLIQDYVETLSTDEKMSIVDGFDQLLETGVVGDEPIRHHAKILAEKMHCTIGAAMMMNFVANSVFRSLAQPTIAAYRQQKGK